MWSKVRKLKCYTLTQKIFKSCEKLEHTRFEEAYYANPKLKFAMALLC